jgi:hypothetical protein
MDTPSVTVTTPGDNENDSKNDSSDDSWLEEVLEKTKQPPPQILLPLFQNP